MERLYVTQCRRCGKEITSMRSPIYTGGGTMRKYQGICAGCMSEKEKFEMMIAMNNDVKNRI